MRNLRLSFPRDVYLLALAALLLLSLPVKLHAARDLVWELDYVPVVARGQAFFDGGPFPTYGTLSSVAAYNMPFLVWLQMPAMFFTRDVALILVGTQLAINLLATVLFYRAGAALFDRRAGLAAAGFFTFSLTGVSSAYTAWAQLLLPAFYILLLLLLWRWAAGGRARYLALAGAAATAAFMTHFAAVLLYPAAAAWALATRAPLSRRGLAGAALATLLLLGPYLLFQIERDFVDLRAFFSRSTNIPQEVMAQYEHLKPGGAAVIVERTEDAALPSPEAAPPPEQTPQRASVVERGLQRLLAVPEQIYGGLMMAFRYNPRELEPVAPALTQVMALSMQGLALLFWLGAGAALWGTGRALQAAWRTAERGRWWRWRTLAGVLVGTEGGHGTLLLLMLLVHLAGFIVTRNAYNIQPTYYVGLLAWQYLLAAYGLIWLLRRLPSPRVSAALLAALLIGWGGLNTAFWVVRLDARDYTGYSGFNVALYRYINEATAWIAQDWGQEGPLTVSYDIMPESRRFWWVVPWHTVDPLYGIGMAYDYLLASYYGLHNTNDNPVGLADNPDYIVVYAPGLARHDLTAHEVQQFGPIYVLRPQP